MGEPDPRAALDDHLLEVYSGGARQIFRIPIGSDVLKAMDEVLDNLTDWKSLHGDDLEFCMDGAIRFLDDVLDVAARQYVASEAEEFRNKIKRLGYFPALEEE